MDHKDKLSPNPKDKMDALIDRCFELISQGTKSGDQVNQIQQEILQMREWNYYRFFLSIFGNGYLNGEPKLRDVAKRSFCLTGPEDADDAPRQVAGEKNLVLLDENLFDELWRHHYEGFRRRKRIEAYAKLEKESGWYPNAQFFEATLSLDAQDDSWPLRIERLENGNHTQQDLADIRLALWYDNDLRRDSTGDYLHPAVQAASILLCEVEKLARGEGDTAPADKKTQLFNLFRLKGVSRSQAARDDNLVRCMLILKGMDMTKEEVVDWISNEARHLAKNEPFPGDDALKKIWENRKVGSMQSVDGNDSLAREKLRHAIADAGTRGGAPSKRE